MAMKYAEHIDLRKDERVNKIKIIRFIIQIVTAHYMNAQGAIVISAP